MFRDWLINGLKKPTKSGADLARFLNVDPSIVYKMKSGTRAISADEALKISKYLDEPLPSTVDRNQTTTSLVMIRVRGVIAGGLWRETGVDPVAESASIPVVSANNEIERYALQVSGNSVNKLISHGSYAICIPYWHARTDKKDGDLVHVERRRGELVEATIKRLRHIDGVWELRPESDDESFQDSVILETEDTDEVEIIGLVVGTYSEF